MITDKILQELLPKDLSVANSSYHRLLNKLEGYGFSHEEAKKLADKAIEALKKTLQL